MSSNENPQTGAPTAAESAPPAGKSNPDFVDALARGLKVIQAFSGDAPEMTLTEVARRTGLSPATARRCLMTLRELGYVGTNGRRFLLRSRVLSLGSAFINSMNLKDLADAYLQDVAETFHDAASLGVLEDSDVVYIAHVPSRREARFRVAVGSHLPAFCTSMGHAILANLSDAEQRAFLAQAPFPRYTARTISNADELEALFHAVRTKGYAVVQDQLEYGSIAIAVPVRDTKGRVVAAINCSSETSRVAKDELIATRLPMLLDTARQVGEAMIRYPALMHSVLPER